MSTATEKLKQRWKKWWTRAKEKIQEKIQEKAKDWSEAVTSVQASDNWKTRTREAIEHNTWLKGVSRFIKEFGPQAWAQQTLSGIRSKTLTDVEADKWAKRAADYIEVVKYARKVFRQLSFSSGTEAAKWWADNVSNVLHEMKLGKISKEEAKKRIEEAAKSYGTQKMAA